MSTKVEDILKSLDFHGAPPPTDAEVTTTCPRCGTLQTLKECVVNGDGHETTYTCRSGCQIVVVVGEPGLTSWPGRGYRIGSHVIRNVADVIFRGVLLPASATALYVWPRPRSDG
jgi:hypothetical protein